jgi:predicted DsbA family dithiol-disulfide isomerase
MESDLIQADCIESMEFPELAEKYRVYAVPKTVINEGAFIEGSLPEDFFLDQILQTLQPAESSASEQSAQ